jgi:hypothetical protein
MQPSTDDLLIRQISALISATADASSPSKEYAPFMEARLYETWLPIAPKSRGSQQYSPRADLRQRQED